jgi:DUF177 domain-containing protein
MRLQVNLRHLEAHPVHLVGVLTVAELDINSLDEVIQVNQPLKYDLEVEKVEGGLLVQGALSMSLDCQCVRCLKKFRYALDLPQWHAHMPLEGEESVTPTNDCVDLTPTVREDILLEFPRHPLCEPECRGLPAMHTGQKSGSRGFDQTDAGSSAWAELNKLKF